MSAVYISVLFPYYRIESNQDRARERATHLLFHPGRNQDPRLERNFSDASLDAEVLVGKEGRKLHASQGRNLERYL